MLGSKDQIGTKGIRMTNNRPHWADTAIAVFTGLMLITYVTSNYFSCQQFRLTKRTLEEVQRGGTDTHELAVQARNQADRTKDIADRALAQAASTNELARQARRSADAAKAQAIETGKLAKLTQDSLDVSQKAYVTVGRPDGDVAEIILPSDPTGKAAVLVFFQNTGHIPARFNWGNDSAVIAVVPSSPGDIKEPYGSTADVELHTDHFFRPMYRARVRDQKGAFTWSGTITIAGNSAYEGVLWEVPKERMVQLMSLDRPFAPGGRFEYCDGFGHRVCRNFRLQYAGNPYNKLFLATEEGCMRFQTQILNPDPKLEYLSPCEAEGEREELNIGFPDPPGR